MNYKYDLTFYEALELVLQDECWVQGENFADGVVLFLYNTNIVKCKDFTVGEDWDMSVTKNLVSQKFRKVYTQPSAERRI